MFCKSCACHDMAGADDNLARCMTNEQGFTSHDDAGLAEAQSAIALPRGWAHWHRSHTRFHMLQTILLYLPSAVSRCAGTAEAWRDGALPRGWAHWHRSDAEFHRLQTPLLHLPSADPVSYLEQHGHMLGHTARSVMHIGPEV